MCVAIPGRVISIGTKSPASVPGRVDIAGTEREVDLVMVPHVQVGDYVVVHSGYAIRTVPAAAADEALDLFESNG